MTVLNASSVDRWGFPVLSREIDPALTYRPAILPRPISAPVETGPCADAAVRRLFAAHTALASLSEQDRAALLRSSKIRIVKPHEVICYQGDPVAHVIFVLEGFLKLSTTLADGSEVFMEIVSTCRCVGETTVLRTRVHDADTTALSASRLLMIDAMRFRQVFDRNPEGLLAILRLADERRQAAVERLSDSRARTAPIRLAKALLEVTRLPGSAPGNGTSLPLRLSQSELGVMAGMSREMVNKHLALWRDAGWIRMSAGTVASIDVDALSAMFSDYTAH
ncbi:Crp/Fnr family transcriptional regulator [Acidisphaera sp. S103]|uniref:Crp/Fnr family transcriptional regulator n=1 Tax=Acidisphaera sp. S103 TaxID=1747223 RepID=UPI00131D414C|nr:Crp/Fnr family transcriptional regulator [Acidisphaera sp. S103]